MANETLYAACDAFWKESALKALEDFIRVPSVSTGFDPDWEENGFLDKACELSVAWAKSVFPKAAFEIHREKGRTPVIFYEIAASTGCEGKPAVGFYGHLDKLPGFEGWADGIDAFTPRIRDGKLFGRGGADDGYAFYLALAAVKAVERAGLSHPRIIGVFETREECGCADMPHWMQVLHDRLGKVGAMFVLDSDCCRYDNVYLTTSLRGLIVATLSVKTMTAPVHSGSFSGLVPDAYAIGQALLSRTFDFASGKVKLPEFFTEIEPGRRDKLAASARELKELVYMDPPMAEGVALKVTDYAKAMLSVSWEPTMTVIGIDGMPSVAEGGNAVPAEVVFSLSGRVPPQVDAKAAARALGKALTEDVPYGAQVAFKADIANPGWAMGQGNPEVLAGLEASCRNVFGKNPYYLAVGSSIPVANDFERHMPGVTIAMTGLLGPESNAHAKNEAIDLAYMYRLTHFVADFVASQA